MEPPSPNAVTSPDQPSKARHRGIGVSLTFASNQGRELARQALQIVTWPVIVNALGPAVYGMWVLINQLGYFAQITDLKASNVLGVLLSRERANPDQLIKRRLIGAHLLLALLCFSVIMVIAGCMLVATPKFITIPAELKSQFQISLCIAFTGIALAPVLTLPQMALYSENLAWRGFKLVVFVDITAPVLSALAAKSGCGVVGLSAINFVAVVTTALIMYSLASKLLPYFGAARPSQVQIRQMFGYGLRYQVDSVAWLLSENSASIAIAFFLDLKAAGLFAISERLFRAAQAVSFRIANAAAPSIGEFSGKGDLVALQRCWDLTQALITLVSGTAFVCLVSSSTLVLDVLFGPQSHAGLVVSTLLAIKFLLLSRTAAPAYFLNQMLRLKKKNQWSLLWTAVTAVAILVMLPLYGLPGITLALLAGVIVVNLGYTYEVGVALQIPIPLLLTRGARQIGMSLLTGFLILLFAHSGIGKGLWLAVTVVVLSATIGLGACWLVALNAQERKQVGDVIKRTVSAWRQRRGAPA